MVGCAQRPGLDFDQVTCNTLQASSLRMLAALAALNNLHMRRWDFEAAYLQGELKEVKSSIAVRRWGTPPPVTTGASSCGGLSGLATAWPKHACVGSAAYTPG